MAIIYAIVITPPNAHLKIVSDSRAALAELELAQRPILPNSLIKSPNAYLWLHARKWIQYRRHPVYGRWTKGHAGTMENEKADELAATAYHDESAKDWTLDIPPPDSHPYWLQCKSRIIPWHARRIIRSQDENLTAISLAQQVNAIPGRTPQTLKQIDIILEVIGWTIGRDGSTIKNLCARTTNSQDLYIRSFAVKQLFDLLPTMERQNAWYPDIYKTSACSKCNYVPENIEHIITCFGNEEQFEFEIRKNIFRMDNKKILDRPTIDLALSNIQLNKIQGRICTKWKNEILNNELIKNTKMKIQILLRAILEVTYNLCWKKRSEIQNQHESKNGLTNRQKLIKMKGPRPTTETKWKRNFPSSYKNNQLHNSEIYCSFIKQIVFNKGV